MTNSRPQFTKLKFDISYEKDGIMKKIPKYVQDIILRVVNKKYYKALKIILKTVSEDKIIYTTLSQLLGTSVSEIVDQVTAAIEYPGPTNQSLYSNKKSDHYSFLRSGTFNASKTYSNLSMTDNNLNTNKQLPCGGSCPDGFACKCKTYNSRTRNYCKYTNTSYCTKIPTAG